MLGRSATGQHILAILAEDVPHAIRQVHAVESWLVRESDSLITCSASMRDEITELFGPGLAETHVIRNGIDCGRWPFARRRPRSSPARLLYVGRLEYEKGIHDAIAALPRIRRTHPGTTLTIAGEGTQLDWLVEQARKHKVLKATAFAGHLDHDALVNLLHTADAAVLPSHYEPFGIVALEAAATGVPLVTSNVGGLGEAVINGETGVSFPPRDIAGLAVAVFLKWQVSCRMTEFFAVEREPTSALRFDLLPFSP